MGRLVRRTGQGRLVGLVGAMVGNAQTWPLPIYSYPAADHPTLKVAIELLSAGKKDETAQGLAAAIDDLRGIARIQ